MARKSSHNEKENSKPRRRWPWVVLVIIVVLVAVARLSLKSSFVHNIARSQIEQISNEMLNGQLQIGHLQGDLWKEIKLVDVSLTTPDTLLRADTLYAQYRVLSYFTPPFQLDLVRIDKPAVHVAERRDGSLNLQHLIKEQPSVPADTTASFTINVDQFSIQHGTVNGIFPSLQQDSLIAIQNLNIDAGFAYLGDQYNLQLRELDFDVAQTRLSPVEVSTSARASQQQMTLEKLVIGTGRSMLQSSAFLSLEDSTTTLDITGQPISWRDVSAYMESFPLRENIQLDLNMEGTLSAFEIGLQAEAAGLKQFSLNTNFRWRDALLLRRAELNIAELNLATLLADTAYPQLRELQFIAEGEVDITNIEQASLEGRFSARDLQQEPYLVNQLSGTYALKQGAFNADLEVNRAQEQLNGTLTAEQIWSDMPGVSMELVGRNLQPAYWMQDEQFAGTINGTVSVDGQGFELAQQFWSYDVDLKDSEIGGQQFAEASFSGHINADSLVTDSQVRIKESRLRLQAQVADYMDIPKYTYNLNMNQLNLAECRGLEDLPTAINARVRGEGRYINPEQLQLTSSLRVDSSFVNKEFIEELNARVEVQDTVARVSDGRLRSAIADGNFNARLHLTKWYDVANRLDLDVQVKDLQTFAALADVETLRTTGDISGQLRPVFDDELQFTGSVDFRDLVYGDMLTTDQVEGSVEVLLMEEPEYVLKLALENPVISSVVLQDFETTVRGKMSADSTHGDLQLMFRSSAGNRLQHFGTYRVGAETAMLRTRDLQIISDLRRLELTKPFDLEVTGQSFRMDTLRLASDDGAIMEAAIPSADTLSQRGYLMGQNLNLTVIQNTLLNESYFEGLLSGRIFIDRQDTLLSATGDIRLDEMTYQDTSLDSLDLQFEIQNERLEGGLNLFDAGQRLAFGQLRVPFKIGDPNTFRSSFFEEEVAGLLQVPEISVSRFQGLLNEVGITNTTGLVRINGRLQGTAGDPEMNAAFRLRNGTISGVAVDSVTTQMDYDHSARQLDVNGSIMSLKQKAAEITASIPVTLDLKNFNVILPGQSDSIRAEITTNGFNLASLNDFVDRAEIREIQGGLDGSVTISGPLEQLAAKGELNFQRGAVRIMEAGIKVTDIRSDIYFEGDRVRVGQFRARSGSGNFTAKGSMNFDELKPGTMDISMVANNFRIANVADYSAIVDMKSRLSGTLQRPELKGSLSFVSGFMYLQNFGEKSVEAIELDSTAASTGYDNYVQYDSLSLDMDISFNRRFYVRNRRYLDLEYELDGQIDLLKQRGEDLQLFGALGAASGYARPLGKQFQLEEGVITFQGDPTNPQLNVRHLFEPPQQGLGDVRIWYIIEGRVEDPKFRYDSDPPMGLEDIISYTLFGKPFMSLDPWKQVVANSGSNASAADVAMDVLLDKVETIATQRLGIDLVQIDNTQSGSNTGTSIKTGWYLNPRLFFAIQNQITGSTPNTIFTLEYLLEENLKLIITQGSDSQAGLDLRWNYDY